PWTKAGKARKAERLARKRERHGPGRMERWRIAINSGQTATSALALLALTAVAIEAASMVPYLAALGLLTAADLAPTTAAVVLAAYCLVMIAPALVALGLRVGLHRHVMPTLTRLEGWISRNSREALA